MSHLRPLQSVIRNMCIPLSQLAIPFPVCGGPLIIACHWKSPAMYANMPQLNIDRQQCDDIPSTRKSETLNELRFLFFALANSKDCCLMPSAKNWFTTRRSIDEWRRATFLFTFRRKSPIIDFSICKQPALVNETN